MADRVYIEQIKGVETEVEYRQGKILLREAKFDVPIKLNDRSFTGRVKGIAKDGKFYAYRSFNKDEAKNWDTIMCDLLWLQTNKFNMPQYEFYEDGKVLVHQNGWELIDNKK